MSEYFKPKDLLHKEGDKVKVTIIKSDPIEEGKFGLFYPTVVEVGGQQYNWTLSQDHAKRLKESGCGKEFWIVAYKNAKGFIGFNFAPTGDVSLSVGNDVTSETKAFTTQKNDDFQDKVSRGAAWNNAFAYMLAVRKPLDTTSPYVDDYCLGVASLASNIAPHQKAFVNGEEADSLEKQVSDGQTFAQQSVPDPTPPPEVGDDDYNLDALSF